MELYSFDWIDAVFESHNQSIFRRRGDLQFGRERRALDDEAVIAVGLERLWEPVEDASALVMHQRRFAMDGFGGADHASPIDLADCLVSQADAQGGDASAKGRDQLARNAGLGGRTGSGRDHNVGWLHLLYLFKRHFVIAPHLYLGSQFAQVLIQVVGKAIVIVQQ